MSVRWSRLPLARLAALLAIALACWAVLSYQQGAIGGILEGGLSDQVSEQARLASDFITAGGVPAGLCLGGERRLTVIAPDGRVLYDSTARVEEMDNHNGRPEVIEARAQGSGVRRRHSDTANDDRVYAARLLPDARVVRVSAPLQVESAFKAPIMSAIRRSSALVLLLAVLLMMVQYARNRARTLDLVEVARAFARRAFEHRARAGSGFFGRLGGELNALGERLHATHDDLDRQRALLDGALGVLSEGVACVDRVDRVLFANQAWRHLAAGGVEVVGRAFYEHLPTADLGEALTAARGGHSSPPCEITHRDRVLAVTVAPCGQDVVAVVLHDLSELRRLERARRDFMAAVSHEFKTPLTAIVGFTDTLLDGAIDDPGVARDFTSRISAHAGRLSTLVRDVLTVSRLDRGEWESAPRPVDVADLARQVRDDHQAAAAEKPVRLIVDAPDHLDHVSDDEMLRQVMGNLVSNAIRYNRPAGTVWLRLSGLPAGGLRVVVEDTGIGIAPEHQARVFERFYRIDTHRSRATGGTGLGLSIVKHLVGVLGGRIEMASSAKGTRFTVELPGQPIADSR